MSFACRLVFPLFAAIFIFSCTDKILDPIDKYVEKISSSSIEISSSSIFSISSSSSIGVSSSSDEESSSSLSSSSFGLPPPNFTDCAPPSSPYMARTEYITDLVTIENDPSGTCGEIMYEVVNSSSSITAASISLSGYTAKSDAQPIDITAKATCGTVNLERLCPRYISIAEEVIRFEELDVSYTIPRERIVIEIADGLEATHITCEGSTKQSIGYRLNNKDPDANGASATLPIPPYSTSGNRIYLREWNSKDFDISCKIWNQ